MNTQPNVAAINKALIVSGLSPELATLTERSTTGELHRLSRAAGSTPGQIVVLAESL